MNDKIGNIRIRSAIGLWKGGSSRGLSPQLDSIRDAISRGDEMKRGGLILRSNWKGSVFPSWMHDVFGQFLRNITYRFETAKSSIKLKFSSCIIVAWKPCVIGASFPPGVCLIIFYGPLRFSPETKNGTARKGYVTWRIIGWMERTWLPDGYSQIFRSYVFGPLSF